MCDCVANKSAFCDWLFSEWTAWVQPQPALDAVFTPSLSLAMGKMKPLMIGFVQRGIDQLLTDDIKKAIRNLSL